MEITRFRAHYTGIYVERHVVGEEVGYFLMSDNGGEEYCGATYPTKAEIEEFRECVKSY